jgi:hypothetical protein
VVKGYIVNKKSFAPKMALVAACGILAFAAVDNGIGFAATSAIADARISAAQEALVRYKATHSLEDLRSVVSTMGGTVNIRELTPENLILERRNLVRAWAQILKAIEQSYDPTFDPNERLACPEPPAAQGIQLPPCVSPAAVNNPAARAAYLAELNKYYGYVRRVSYYRQLRNVDDWAMLSLRMSLDLYRQVAPKGVSADFDALDTILQQAALGGARRSRIEQMLQPPVGK